MTKEVKSIHSYEEFRKLISGEKPVLIDFWATWCGPCLTISPVFAKLAGQPEYEAAEFYKVDVDEQSEISAAVGIRAMPTFIAFKDGQKLSELVGAYPAKLAQFVSKNATA